VPKSDSSLSAVVVSGGKQYRVAPGDHILVDRIAAEPGSSLKLGRVLLMRDGSAITVGAPGIDGIDIDVKVLAHRRGPRLESLRYKSKKRVRVHHGGRADLTAIEVLAIGGLTEATGTERKTETGDKPAAKAKTETKKAKAPKAESQVATAAEEKTEAKGEASSKRTTAANKAKTSKETK
jgi:large subunit ribosomal protein L21